MHGPRVKPLKNFEAASLWGKAARPRRVNNRSGTPNERASRRRVPSRSRFFSLTPRQPSRTANGGAKPTLSPPTQTCWLTRASTVQKRLTAITIALRNAAAAALRPTNVIVAVVVLVVLGSATFADNQNRTCRISNCAARWRARSASCAPGSKAISTAICNWCAASSRRSSPSPRWASRASPASPAALHGKVAAAQCRGAPNLKVKLMFPLAGNEKAVGLDYTQNEAQREAAYHARDTGRLVLAGPVELCRAHRLHRPLPGVFRQQWQARILGHRVGRGRCQAPL